MNVVHEEVAFINGGRARVNSDADDTEQKLMLSLDGGVGRGSSWVTPAEARALAALLIKHADRAEGK